MEKKCKCSSNENEKHECKCKGKQESKQASFQEAICIFGEAFASLLGSVSEALSQAAVNVANDLNSTGIAVDEDQVLADMKWLYSNGGREAVADEIARAHFRALAYKGVSSSCRSTLDEIARKVGVYEEIQSIPIDEACTYVFEAVSEKLADAGQKNNDSWGEVFDDSKLDPFVYCKKVGYRLSTCENAERYKSSDLMRRVNTLREREVTKDVN